MKREEEIEITLKTLGTSLSEISHHWATFFSKTGRKPEKLYLPCGLEINGMMIAFLPELKGPLVL